MTSTGQPVHGRSPRWRPRGVSYGYRMPATGRASGGWRPGLVAVLRGMPRPSVAAAQCRDDTGRGGSRPLRPAIDGHERAGLGQPALSACGPRGAFGGHQPQVCADAAPGESLPITDLDSQTECGQRGHSTQTAQSPHHRSELRIGGHCGDRGIETVPPVPGRQHRVKGFVVGERQGGRVELLAAQPQFMLTCPGRAAAVHDR